MENEKGFRTNGRTDPSIEMRGAEDASEKVALEVVTRHPRLTGAERSHSFPLRQTRNHTAHLRVFFVKILFLFLQDSLPFHLVVVFIF